MGDHADDLAEQLLLYLSHRIAWQRIAHANLARALVRRQPVRDEVDEVRFRNDFVQDDICDDALPEIRIVDADDGHLCNCGVPE